MYILLIKLSHFDFAAFLSVTVADDVKVQFKGADSYLYNNKTGHRPLIILGNGPAKPDFNRLSNYLGANAWTMTQGCRRCKENTLSLEGVPVSIYNISLSCCVLIKFICLKYYLGSYA